jgi:hypothetical protein
MDDNDAIFNREFFYTTPNHLAEWFPTTDENLLKTLRLVDVHDFAPGHNLQLVMDDDEGRAVGFLQKELE